MLVPAAVLVLVLMRWDALVALFVGTMLGAICAVVVQPEIVEQLAIRPSNPVARLDADGQFAVSTLKGSETTIQLKGADLLPAATEILEFEESDAGTLVYEPGESSVLFVPAADFIGEARIGFKTRDGEDSTTWQNLSINVNQPNRWIQGYRVAVNAMADSTSIETGDEIADGLLSGKGMAGMLSTIWLIICAMCFGGAMEACGLLQRITAPLIAFARSVGALIGTTVASCVFLNLTASDQYLAIVVPGRMFRKTFADRGLAPQNLSRTLEDGGTVTSVLVPWNTCGATQSAVLGIPTLAFAPYCFFNWISPLMTIVFGAAQLQIAKLSHSAADDAESESPTPLAKEEQ